MERKSYVEIAKKALDAENGIIQGLLKEQLHKAAVIAEEKTRTPKSVLQGYGDGWTDGYKEGYGDGHLDGYKACLDIVWP